MKRNPALFALMCGWLLTSACGTTRPSSELVPPAAEVPRDKPDCAPPLPQVCTLRDTFDRMSLDDQSALVLGCMGANEHRRRVVEATLERCAAWVRRRP